MNGARLLFVGREDGVVRGWIGRIRDAGGDVAVVGDGDAALRHLGMLDPEAVLVDVRQDGELDGFDVCRRLRDRTRAILVLAATGAGPFDEVVALAVGADHFVAAETPVEVIEARLRSGIRRTRGLVGIGAAADGAGPAPSGRPVRVAGGAGGGRDSTMGASPRGGATPTSVLDAGPDPSPIVEGDLEIDPLAREVRVAGEPVELTRIEFELLLTLVRQPRRVFTREQLLIAVWDEPFDGSHVLDTHLSRLRGKVTAAGGERVAHAVRGVGYRLRA